jgi:hypothetical protein
MLFLRCEDIAAGPRALADRVHRFLGVAPRPGDSEGLGRINPSDRHAAPPLDGATARALARRYTEPNRRLAELLGKEFEPWQRA